MNNRIILNARQPKKDFYGKLMLTRMNIRHNEMAQWALSYLNYKNAETILDIGCGGGRNIHKISKVANNATVYGIDYSDASIEKCKKYNRKAISQGNVKIIKGNVENLPFNKESFDVITAFETVYYWPKIKKCFSDIYNILKPGGYFMICNEDSSPNENQNIVKLLNMNIYTQEELENLFSDAGFSDIKSYKHTNGEWICIIGRKG